MAGIMIAHTIAVAVKLDKIAALIAATTIPGADAVILAYKHHKAIATAADRAWTAFLLRGLILEFQAMSDVSVCYRLHRAPPAAF